MVDPLKMGTDIVYLVLFLYMSYRDVYYTFIDDRILFISGIIPILYIGSLTHLYVPMILLSASTGILSFMPTNLENQGKITIYVSYILISVTGLLLIGSETIPLILVPIAIVVLMMKRTMGEADLVLLSSFGGSVSLFIKYTSIDITTKVLYLVYSLIGFIAMSGVMFFVTGLVAISYACEKKPRIFFSDKLRIRGIDLLRAPWFIDIPGIDPNIDIKEYKKRRKEIAKRYRNRCVDVVKKIPLVPPLSFMIMVLLFSI